MKIGPSDVVVPILLAVAGIISLVFWFRVGPTDDLQKRIPGLDRPADSQIAAAPRRTAPVAGEPALGAGVASKVPGEWPAFRGGQRDNVSIDATQLLRSWPNSGPPQLWSLELGEGYAGAVISEGRVYVLDYDAEAAADTLRCLSLDDGREIWTNSYPVQLARNHGMSRTVPAVVDQHVITLGPQCHLACWDAGTGSCLWLIDLVLQHGASVPRWYAGQCPLVDQDRLIVAPGGNALLVAIDYRTGDVIWESPNPRGWKMTHSSIVPMEFEGRRMYVYCGSGGVAGIAADDGSLLWECHDWVEQFAASPSPVVLPGGRIFLCSGYGSKIGSIILQLKTDSDRLVAETVIELAPKQFNAEHHTPILHQGHLFGVRKRGGGQLVCLDLDGKEIWNSGADRFGHGPFLVAGDLLFAMDDHGALTMAVATPQTYQRLARHEVFPDGHDAWGPMAIAGGRLIVRDMTRMACLDLSAD